MQVIVASADLSGAGLEQHLVRLATLPTVRGIRQILNWEPTWPNVTASNTINEPAFRAGYAKLADHQLSFDLHVCAGMRQSWFFFFSVSFRVKANLPWVGGWAQINPHQMMDAAALAHQVS